MVYISILSQNMDKFNQENNLPEERVELLLNAKGFKFVTGVDEAGRGPLAGPVVACAATVLDWNMDEEVLKWVKDSKKLSEKRRDFLYEKVKDCQEIRWGIGIVDEKKIDEINIFQAAKMAMVEAVNDLSKKVIPDFLIIDGNTTINYKVRQKAVIKGDSKIFSCSLASIIAKVTRDKIMYDYVKQYPHYGFEKHKGYGTKAHIDAIQAFGPCPIHRRTFNPVSLFI
ncbi:MAG: ribonuclease HII [Minisyncoccus archaeiphilus]|nr:MAG: ribonuclease HII [Candidatus Parcubacteria bacterium]